jgi:hypothetical protein
MYGLTLGASAPIFFVPVRPVVVGRALMPVIEASHPVVVTR